MEAERGNPFEVLYRRHVQEVLNTVYLFVIKHYSLVDQGLAWQVTHDTFLQAFERLPQKNAQSPFLAWIKVIAVHEAQQDMRRKNRERAIKDEIQYPPDDPALLDQSPEEQLVAVLERIELHEKIERVKQRLPKQQQRVFRMHYEQGYSPQKIASELDIKPASAWQALWRANRRFKREWEKDGGEPGISPPVHKGKKGGKPGAPGEV